MACKLYRNINEAASYEVRNKNNWVAINLDGYFLDNFFFSSRRRHTRSYGDWSSDVCSSDLVNGEFLGGVAGVALTPRPSPIRWARVASGSLPLVLGNKSRGGNEHAARTARGVEHAPVEIGRASCRERGSSAVVAEE